MSDNAFIIQEGLFSLRNRRFFFQPIMEHLIQHPVKVKITKFGVFTGQEGYEKLVCQYKVALNGNTQHISKVQIPQT